MNHLITRWSPAAILLIAGSTHSLAAGPFGASFELSSLNGANGFVIKGVDPDNSSGWSVSSAGDVNGDGFDDLIIGVRRNSRFNTYTGENYVVFGGVGVGVGAGGLFELSTINGTNGFVFRGIDAVDHSAKSVSCAGDVNGDGVDDLIIGAYKANPNGQGPPGECYVVFGAVGVGASGTFELSSLNGMNGFVIKGIDAGDSSGWSVSSAGDVNGDGVNDLIIGGRSADPNFTSGAGESYVIFGGPGVGAGGVFELSTLNGTNGFICNGIDAGDGSGFSVSSAGDVNGDGVDDLIIGARGADPIGFSSGESYVVFGSASVGIGGRVHLFALFGSNGFVCNGIARNDVSGHSVSSAGDVNDDGVDDLIIGAPGADPNGAQSGESYVVFGGVGGFAASLELSSLNGANGFVIKGIDAGDGSGGSVSSAGDVNGDGVDDLIIGAAGADPNGSVSGESYVVFGGVGVGAGGTFELSTINGTNGFVINGIDENDGSGHSVSLAGDVNGDGVDDLIIGASSGGVSHSSSGECYVIFGRTPCPPDLNADRVIDTADLGILIRQFNTADPGADINTDGVVDMVDLGILIGAFGTACP